MMVRRSLILPVLTVGASLFVPAQPGTAARRAPTLNNLRGIYKGNYTPTNGLPAGTIKVQITADVKRRNSVARTLKGVLTLGNKRYVLTAGNYEPTTKQVNLAGVIGRRYPNITQVTVTGFMNDDARGFAGGYTVVSPAYQNVGNFSAAR